MGLKKSINPVPSNALVLMLGKFDAKISQFVYIPYHRKGHLKMMLLYGQIFHGKSYVTG